VVSRATYDFLIERIQTLQEATVTVRSFKAPGQPYCLDLRPKGSSVDSSKQLIVVFPEEREALGLDLNALIEKEAKKLAKRLKR
jgi:hypothetical protein